MLLFLHSCRSKCLLPLVLCIGLPAFAQFSAATVAGVVQDSSKAAITDASLKLINTQSGTENDSTTDPEGKFFLAGIIPGAYTLQIERDGFATTNVSGIDTHEGGSGYGNGKRRRQRSRAEQNGCIGQHGNRPQINCYRSAKWTEPTGPGPISPWDRHAKPSGGNAHRPREILV
jgi:hypothetical protein